METDDFIVVDAVADDANFLGRASFLAERAHTGIGIWDVVFPERTEEVLAHACLNDTNSHLHFTNFKTLKNKFTGINVGAACGFLYDNFSVTKSMPGLTRAMMELGIVSSEDEGKERWARINFLDSCFPEEFNYKGAWVLECVFVESYYRGQGLAVVLLSSILECGKKQGLSRAWLVCAIGNHSALRMYQKLGFEIYVSDKPSVIISNVEANGEERTGDHEGLISDIPCVKSECENALNIVGFHLLHKCL